MTRVHVCGASGYAGIEMIALLHAHPHFELGALESASHTGDPLGAHAVRLRGVERTFDAPGAALEWVRPGDAVVLAGGHGIAKAIAPEFLARGAKVVDLSGDFRLHPTPAVYGFPERYRAQIAEAQFVANPGCYPTATLLATLPLAPFKPQAIIVDAKSGVTGAGRTPRVDTLYAEVSGEIRVYGLNGHRHEPEIVQEWRAAGIDAALTFTPHVVPLERGMLVNAYAMLPAEPDAASVFAAYERAYSANAHVRLVRGGASPSPVAMRGTNGAEIHVSVHGNVVRSICAIDNLGRGAATAALVNLNLMHGYPEELGVSDRALV
ncbi:MAG TPA: N-acetyl-gamma-glutamyl-phosphate reductase [Candidatus Baltobacteraceae bacterium]|nr:N-acetyl-gamma-glutamyl-phosphate reductase [Candidatus Baltobacteraceae bacterium]